jgi:hypothetical protein
VDQVENTVSGTKVKIEELYQTVKDYEAMLRIYNGACKISGTQLKDQICESWVLEKEKRYKLKA